MRPGIDIIVVNYRTDSDLREFMQSVSDYRPTVPFSVFVMNVDPIDTTPNLDFPGPYTYHLFTENVGYSRAVNYGAALGDRETIAIFNADTRLQDAVATDCHYALHSEETWGILGPRQIDEQGLITHGGIFKADRGFHQRNSPEFGDVRDDATTVSGSAYFVKRSVWDELTECQISRQQRPVALGAFLPTPHYYEETWCSYHARAHGYKCVYYGAATMIHKWHRASPRGGFADKQVTISRQMFEEACAGHDIDI